MFTFSTNTFTNKTISENHTQAESESANKPRSRQLPKFARLTNTRSTLTNTPSAIFSRYLRAAGRTLDTQNSTIFQGDIAAKLSL